MIYYGIGIRRKKNNVTLDVLYPEIKNDKKIDDIINLIDTKISDNGVTTIATHDYFKFRDTLFPSLPSDIQETSENYSKTDFVIAICSNLDEAPTDTEMAYFKLQLLSQRKVKPHGQNLTGIFALLQNIAWTNIGPVLPVDLPNVQAKAILKQQSIEVSHVDKFPYMVNYHVPSGVRIADSSRVRLGAYLGDGTTVMPAGFINFNAGTMGNAMVEGRISAGVIVGEDSDIGGGASIMGTLSGGNDVVISIGKKCLLGANAGTGISLGDGCTIAAGVYVYAGKKVTLLDEQNNAIDVNGNMVQEGQNIVKAMDLSGKDYLMFIEDSQTGELICKPNSKVIQLNNALHKN